jgi:UDP:flavonoid glycosyltransferase YjiC (YdhE family)
MRVLLATPPLLGHVLPMVPLAQAIQNRGHDVLWATGPDSQGAVRNAGLHGVVAGLTAGEAMQEFWRRHPEARALPPEQVPAAMFSGMFGEVAAPAMVTDLLPVVREWQPQLVVHDAAALAGPVIAAMLGVPGVTKSFGPLLPRQRVEKAADAVAPLWRALGLRPAPFAGCYQHLYLDVYPPGLQGPLPEYVGRTQLLHPIADDRAADRQPAELSLPDGSAELPLIYLTMGTVFADGQVLRGAVKALAGLDCRLLVTVGPSGDPADMGQQPSHVRVERYVAQTQVLGHCQVVVSHGGSGTVLGALALGLPQLCLPRGADQFLNAAAVVRAGAGLALTPDEASGRAIAAATTELLQQSSFRECASRQAEQLARMPGPDEVAEVLETLS